MTAPWVHCGRQRLQLAHADHFEPPGRLARAADPPRLVDGALAEPVSSPDERSGPLAELAEGARRVVIAVPDGSRPCPTRTLLPPLLDHLGQAGVRDTDVTVLVGCGMHATTTKGGRVVLAGHDVVGRVSVLDAQGRESPMAKLGVTGAGTPVHLARQVADADLVVAVGVVEPHLYAGFSGGVKAVAIGCAGEATIAWTHRPAFVSAPGVRLCELYGNPFQNELQEIAAHCALRFALNVVVDDDGWLVAAAAGGPVLVQRTLAEAHRGVWTRPVPGTFDVVVAGVHAPKSVNLYQASRAATYVGTADQPALADGGLLVLCADLPDGPGAGPAERNFAALLAEAVSPRQLVDRGLQEPLGPGGQRAFVVARVLQRFRIAVVGCRKPDWLRPLGMEPFASVPEALAAERAHLARDPRVLVVADATKTIVHAA